MIKLNEIENSLLYEFKSEHELVESIKDISFKFTQDRSLIGEYVKSDKLVSAYTCFYMLTNLPKLTKVLDKIKFTNDNLKNYEVVDIGSGPGTFIFSLLKINENLKVYGIEKSEAMIRQSQKIIGDFFPASDVSIFDNIKRIPKKLKKRLGIFGHSANEMNESTVLDMIQRLDLDEILFIEPGTKDFFKKSLNLRTDLIRNGFNIHFPCPSNSKCPMQEGDWCHQYINVKHEASVERLCQLVSKDRRLLPLTIHYYKKEEKVFSDSKIVRVYKPTKFSIEWQICNLHDDKNSILDLQILNKTLNKKKIKEVKEFTSGDSIEFEEDKQLSEKKIRGRLL